MYCSRLAVPVSLEVNVAEQKALGAEVSAGTVQCSCQGSPSPLSEGSAWGWFNLFSHHSLLPSPYFPGKLTLICPAFTTLSTNTKPKLVPCCSSFLSKWE